METHFYYFMSIPAKQTFRHQPIMFIVSYIMLCCSAQNFDLLCSVKDLCLKSDCSIRVYSLVSKIVSVLLEYIDLY